MINSDTPADGRKDSEVSSYAAASERLLLDRDTATADVQTISLELSALADTIVATPHPIEAHRALSRIRDLGSINPETFRSILDPLLKTSSFGCKTLYILCVDWGLTEYYAKELLDFVKRGQPKSDLVSCFVDAVMIATDYLRTHSDPELLSAIIDLYESSNSTRRERGAAENALWHLFGQSHDGNVLLRRAKARLAQEA
jgi:hypothetical protein